MGDFILEYIHTIFVYTLFDIMSYVAYHNIFTNLAMQTEIEYY